MLKRLIFIFVVLFYTTLIRADVDEFIGVSTVDEYLGISTIDEVVGQTVAAAGGGCTDGGVAVGYNGADSAMASIAATTVFCYKYTSTCAGNIDEIKTYVQWQDTNEYATAGIYADNSGPFGTVLRDAPEMAGNQAGGEWITYSLDSALTITDSTDYWLCLQGNSLFTLGGNSAGSASYCYVEGIAYSAGNMPDLTAEACDSSGTDDGSIYGVGAD